MLKVVREVLKDIHFQQLLDGTYSIVVWCGTCTMTREISKELLNALVGRDCGLTLMSNQFRVHNTRIDVLYMCDKNMKGHRPYISYVDTSSPLYEQYLPIIDYHHSGIGMERRFLMDFTEEVQDTPPNSPK